MRSSTVQRPRARVELDKRPVVVAVALGAPAGRDALPGPRRTPPEQGVGAPGAAGGPDRVVAGHRQHLPDAAALQAGSELGVGAVDLIAGHPTGWDPGVQRTGD